MRRQADAEIYAAIGATGSGKSSFIKELLDTKAPPRVLVWDPKGEYAATLGAGARTIDRVDVLDMALQAAAKHPKAPFRIAFTPPRFVVRARDAAFRLICKRLIQAKHIFFVLEEAHRVLVPGQGNDEFFTEIITAGRAEALAVAVVTQRPALVDKNTLGNATVIRCYKLGYPEDARVMARALGVAADELTALERLQYVQRDTNSNKLTRGRVVPRH